MSKEGPRNCCLRQGMPQPISLCLQVTLVVIICGWPYWNLLINPHTAADYGFRFSRIICEQANAIEPQVVQDFCSDAVVPSIHFVTKSQIRVNGVESLILEAIGLDFYRENR